MVTKLPVAVPATFDCPTEGCHQTFQCYVILAQAGGGAGEIAQLVNRSASRWPRYGVNLNVAPVREIVVGAVTPSQKSN